MMAKKTTQKSAARAHWSNRLAFILVAAGSAIGLGNLWKFPYVTGVNGGGAFVLVYLICIALVGLPLLLAELSIGQTSQSNAITAFEVTHRKGSPWRMIGWLGVLSAFLILSFYSVVGGWVLDFTFRSLSNQFAGKTDSQISEFLSQLFSNPARQIFWHFLFMSATVGIVVGGIQGGIEKWNRILMPALLGLLGLLLINSFFLPGFGEALKFLFRPDFSKLHAAGVLEAVGHSFFTLSLGMGCMITYGSYLNKKEDLKRIALSVAFLDTLIAMVAGIIIFSIVFSFQLQPGGGPTLMFKTLPVLFTKMTGGYFISIAFFLLVAFAAFTSAVSLMEVVVTYWVENHKLDRNHTSVYVGLFTFFLGILSALSTNVLSQFHVAGGMTFFDLFDKLTSNIFLPLGGLLISLFFGWILGEKAVQSATGKDLPPVMQTLLLWTLRVFAPVGVAAVLFNGLKNW